MNKEQRTKSKELTFISQPRYVSVNPTLEIGNWKLEIEATEGKN